MLNMGPSGSGKTNALLHVIQNLNDTNPIDKFIYMLKTWLNQNINF